MSYTIGYFVYGVDLIKSPFFSDIEEPADKRISDILNDVEKNYYDDGTKFGDEFITETYQCCYLYFGILTDEIDESSTYTAEELVTKIEKCKTYITQYQNKLEAFLKKDDISNELKDYIKSQEPKAFLCWGTS